MGGGQRGSSEGRGWEKFLWILVLMPYEAASMAQVVNELSWHLRNHAAVRFSQRVCAHVVKNIPAGHSPQFFHQLGLAQTRHGASVQLALLTAKLVDRI